MKNKKSDRRSRRTRQMLSEALIGLMLEKPYDSITVQDIIDRANVGRSTFYAHYLDKEDLLTSQLGEMTDQLSQELEQEGHDEHWFIPSLGLFRHVQSHYHLYKALLWSRATDLIFRTGQAYLTQGVERRIQAQLGGKPLTVPLPVLSNYVAGSLMVLLKWWLDGNMPYSPEQMDAMLRQLVTPGVQAALGQAG